MRKVLTFVTSCALVAFLSVSGAHAQSLTGSASGGSTASVSAGSAGTNVGASGSGSASSDDQSVELGTDASGSAQTGTNSMGDAGSGGSASTGVAGSEISVSLTRDAVSAGANGDVDSRMTASSVVSPGDLSRFAAASFQQDANIESIDAANDHVTVAYRVPARLLGFVPASLTARTTVSQDGTVTIDYPWYRFLFSVPNAVDQADLQASLQGALLANANGSFDAMTEARLIQLIRDTFSGAGAEVDGQVQGSAEAGADASSTGDAYASATSGSAAGNGSASGSASTGY